MEVRKMTQTPAEAAEDENLRATVEKQKKIIENQNGTICARNNPEGGACFDIRFYSH